MKLLAIATAGMLAAALLAPAPAEARTGARHHHAHHHAKATRHAHHVRHRARRSHRAHNSAPARADNPGATSGGLVTVQTAAGLPITVAAHLASRFQGFIADLVASGYRPRHIGSFARGGHVRHSRHYAGAAIDVDQTGWGKTAKPMYHVAALAARHGLRDGCTFRDCGHIDDGASLRRTAHHAPDVRHRLRYARRSAPRHARIASVAQSQAWDWAGGFR